MGACGLQKEESFSKQQQHFWFLEALSVMTTLTTQSFHCYHSCMITLRSQTVTQRDHLVMGETGVLFWVLNLFDKRIFKMNLEVNSNTILLDF